MQENKPCTGGYFGYHGTTERNQRHLCTPNQLLNLNIYIDIGFVPIHSTTTVDVIVTAEAQCRNEMSIAVN